MRADPRAWTLDLGARPLSGSSTHFRVWAPRAETLHVRLVGDVRTPIPLEPDENGYFQAVVPRVPQGMRYFYVLNGTLERPDPISRYQPEGVHGPSEVVDPETFAWSDGEWGGLPLEHFIIYELHTGAFTPCGTFEAMIPRLAYLKHDVGVTAIELMPVAQCPGVRNWGYDGVTLFAPQANYGGPTGLKRLVDACHAHGLAIILDVVYNHLGPEGNYLGDFGPYFTDRYHTPWGPAINYDGPESDAVRHFVISNALYWVHEFHIDALRLDAIHGIYDFGAHHILQEIAEAVHAEAKTLTRPLAVIAESDLNDSRVITPAARGGYGLDGQWNDDFHHALHGLITGERSGYYQDFTHMQQFATALRHGYVYMGQRSQFRRRRHGNSSEHCRPAQFVVYSQNHDQIGNRARGDRHSTLVSWDALKLSSAAVLLSPNIPLLFMGEEYGETAPFQYFIDHRDPMLIEAVRDGRKREFAAFDWDNIPDPYDPETFMRSRLAPKLESDETQQALLRWYRALIKLRKSTPALGAADDPALLHTWVYPVERLLIIRRSHPMAPSALIVLCFNNRTVSVSPPEIIGSWRLRLDANNNDFRGREHLLARTTLDLESSRDLLKLPPYAVWVYSSI